MAETTKRCPRCSGEIDFFGSCRKCGREWSEHLEPDEQAVGLPEGIQHPAVIKKIGTREPRKSRFTKSQPEKQSAFADVPKRFQPWIVELDDSDTEIVQKRSLMRLEARKIYNTMGLAMRTHDAQKAALLWIARLVEILPDEEKKALAPTIERLKAGFGEIKRMASAKAADAAQMEQALEKAHISARRARLKQMDTARKKAAMEKEADKVEILPGETTEGMSVPDLATIDPKLLATLTKEDLIELAKEKLANLDNEKAAKKRQQFRQDEDLFEE